MLFYLCTKYQELELYPYNLLETSLHKPTPTGKIQTDFQGMRRVIEPCLRANISSQLPPPKISRGRKAEGTSLQCIFFLSVAYLVLLSFSIAFGGLCYNRGPLRVPSRCMDPWVPLWGWLCSDTNSEQLQQELCCSPPSAVWRVSMICPRLHKQSRTDVREHGSPRGIAVLVTVVSKAQLTTRSTMPACTTS